METKSSPKMRDCIRGQQCVLVLLTHGEIGG